MLLVRSALDYLVRMSTQWAWGVKSINKVVVTTTAPITVEQVYLRKRRLSVFMEKYRFLILGTGVSGLALAAYLQQMREGI